MYTTVLTIVLSVQTLMNAVLGEDIETVRTLCAKKACCNVNISFKVSRKNPILIHFISYCVTSIIVRGASQHITIKIHKKNNFIQ